MVPFVNGDCVDSVGSGTTVGLQSRFLDDSASGAEDYKIIFEIGSVIQTPNRNIGPDFVIRGDLQQILDGSAFGVFGAFWNFVNFHPKTSTTFCEQQHVMVGRGHDHMLDEIFITGSAAHCPTASTMLDTVFCNRGALDIPHMGNGDYDILFFDHVFHPKIPGSIDDFGAAGVSEFILDFRELVLDNLHAQSFVGDDGFEPGNQGHNLRVFLADFVTLHSGKSLQAQFENSLGLDFTQTKLRYKPFLRNIGG